MEPIIVVIVLFGLIIGSLTDLKKREVPNVVNYSLVVLGVGVNLLLSLIRNDYSYVLYSMIGLGVGYALAVLFFYTGMWGGGDAKALMGIGALLGVPLIFSNIMMTFSSSFFSFLVNTLIVGGFYGLAWGFFLAIIKRKLFVKEYKKIFSIDLVKKIRLGIRIFSIASILLVVFVHFVIKNVDYLYYELMGLSFVFIIFLTFYLWVFVKAIEKSCMIYDVPVEKLTEGDWVHKNVYVGKKLICGPKDLGISKEQIDELLRLKKLGKIKQITIKTGIPFVPSFLIAFILTMIYGNLLILLLR